MRRSTPHHQCRPTREDEQRLTVLKYRRDLIKELMGPKCRCGKAKGHGDTFCRGCYYVLPESMRPTLYRRIGEGYEDAYERACTVLDRMATQERS